MDADNSKCILLSVDNVLSFFIRSDKPAAFLILG